MDSFETFGTAHLVMLGVLLAGLLPAAWLARSRPDDAARDRLGRRLAVGLVAVLVPLQVVDFLPGQFDLATSLPVQLCDLAWVAAAVALWTGHRYPVALTYFWGLPLATQAMLTPALTAAFPEPKFVTFWVMHLAVVWAGVLLVWGQGRGRSLGWRDYGATVATTVAWMVVVSGVNLAAGTNYGYLARKPATSVLDYLGPWPWYVGSMVVVVGLVWALMTWPWARRRS